MCGIAGIVKLNVSSQELAQNAKLMSDAIIHRGPDSSGVWTSPKYPVALSHRRLAILDLSPLGHQPMVTPDGESAIAFNGEIYNFRVLRSELEQAGKSFSGASDTEILLSAIDTYGVDTALSKIKGMFSFAHWNESSGTLTLARDRIGEKPLFYGFVGNSFVFASELKAILNLYPASKFLSLNKQALNSFLRYGYISAPQTIFNEIHKLAPGNKLSLNLAGKTELTTAQLDISVFWSIGDWAGEPKRYSDLEADRAQADLDVLLNKIIAEQSVADVPLGSFLSGGIDSSLVTAYLQSQSQTQIETFTIGFHEKEFNEAEHAKRIAQHLGTAHNELYLNPKDALDCIGILEEINDEPFANASQIPTYIVSKFAKTKLTVCLSGDGGDELFCGYNRYFQGERFSNLARQIPKPMRATIEWAVRYFPLPLVDKLYHLLYQLAGKKGGANIGIKIQKAAEALNIESPDKLYQYLCSYHQQPSNLVRNTEDHTLQGALSFEQDYLDAAMAWDQSWYLPGDNLVKSDRSSMAVSLEMRVPLLDKELIEFSWSVPNSLKYRDGNSKWLLRQLLYKKVPQELIDRPKMGFTIPISQWIRQDLKDWSHDLLSADRLDEQGIFDSLEVEKLLSQHMQGKQDHGNRLWALLMFQSWYQKYWV